MLVLILFFYIIYILMQVFSNGNMKDAGNIGLILVEYRHRMPYGTNGPCLMCMILQQFYLIP